MPRRPSIVAGLVDAEQLPDGLLRNGRLERAGDVLLEVLGQAAHLARRGLSDRERAGPVVKRRRGVQAAKAGAVERRLGRRVAKDPVEKVLAPGVGAVVQQAGGRGLVVVVARRRGGGVARLGRAAVVLGEPEHQHQALPAAVRGAVTRG